MPLSQQPVSGNQADSKRHNASDTVRPNGAPGKPLRILLVEDSPLLRSRLESMLSQYAGLQGHGTRVRRSRGRGKTR